ncbi:MAG: xanthine dehydrogenase family protein molybdopterin-binding subunit, partial [Alphaproteobacteria bacterium]|nr:xanthine dehydrogenase family protein molybdopterin-binding subunit [Alphaproteobacteria bacterium]
MSDTIPLAQPDRPKRYIGQSVQRPNARRLVAGRGTYTDDIVLPRMVHVAFVRSPYAHAKIKAIDTGDAQSVPSLVRIIDGAELVATCGPWRGVLSHVQGLKSAPQHALAVDRVCYQGEPVVAVVAASRAAAEDAASAVAVDYEE